MRCHLALRKCKNAKVLPIFLGGPIGPIHPVWGHLVIFGRAGSMYPHAQSLKAAMLHHDCCGCECEQYRWMVAQARNGGQRVQIYLAMGPGLFKGRIGAIGPPRKIGKFLYFCSIFPAHAKNV